MKFLNHLNVNEHELRAAKMYRASSGTYTPAVSAAGNIILDTSVNIPKWWDGTQWRDFSFGTTGTMNWNIQSDGGSNIQVDQGDTLDLTGGNKITTVTSGTATAPIVTFNHDTQSQSNTTATAETVVDQSVWTTVSGVSVDGYGHVTGVETTAHTLNLSTYTLEFADVTVGSNTGEVALKLVGTDPNYLDSVVIKGGTNIDVDEVNGELVINTTGLTANTDTLYNFDLNAVSGNSTRLILDASSGDDDYVNFSGTTNEIEITTPSTGDAGEVKIGLPDDVTITNNLTVGNNGSFGGNVVITGNLDVNGSTTTLDTTNTAIKDNIIILNTGATGSFGSSGTSGIEIDRGGSLAHTQLLWNDSTHKWTVSEGNSTLTFYNVIQNLFSTATGNTGTATASSPTTALSIIGSNGISTSGSGTTITIDGSGVGNQNLYATFIGDSGTTTASTTTDTLDIEGGTGITTVATNDKVSIGFDAETCGLNIFKNVRPKNTLNNGNVGTGTSAVADAVTDTLDIRTLDESITVAGGDDFITFKSAVKTVAVDIDVSSLTTNKKVHINHGFGTKDLIVQLWQKTAGGKNENVMAGITTVDGNGAASTNHITLQFDYVGLNADITDGDADVRCVIMACNIQSTGGAGVTYS